MYNEINIVDTTFHKINFKNKEYTFQECIDLVLAALEISLKKDDYTYDKKITQQVNDAYKIIAEILPLLWW